MKRNYAQSDYNYLLHLIAVNDGNWP